MPKIPETTPTRVDRTLQNSNTGSAISGRTRNLSYNQPKPVTRDQPGVYIQDSDVELKIKVLAASVATDYIPLDLSKNPAITEKDLINLADTAYIFVDDNGTPVKILASTVLRTEIKWEDLSETTKQKIQQIALDNKLIPGDNISIDENNIISANIGVKTVNGKTKNVILTAADLNAYERDETYSKAETYSRAETAQILATIIVDGGRIE